MYQHLKTMTREEIVEEIAEGIYQYSSCIEEVIEQTNWSLIKISDDVKELVQEKVVSRSIDPKETRENFKELGWY